MLSRSEQYAIKALTYLARQAPGSCCGARDIAAATDIPLPYLWKILKGLANSHLLLSSKGVAGGYCLAREPKKITIEDVLMAVSAKLSFRQCVIARTDCNDDDPCVMHKQWNVFRKRLGRITIADLKRRN